MPWNMKNYPNAFKNFDDVLRKKVIDIANALLASGYNEERTIPIAIKQGKEWYENASNEEITQYKHAPNPSINDEHDTQGVNPELLDNDVEVFYEENVWKVQTVHAKQASDRFKTKKEAVKRAKEIADNRGTTVIKYKKDGQEQS